LEQVSECHVASLRGRTAPGDTFQGGDSRRKNVAAFTENSGQTRP